MASAVQVGDRLLTPTHARSTVAGTIAEQQWRR